MTTGIGRRRIEAFQKTQAVHFRHLDIERQHVRIQDLDHFPGLVGAYRCGTHHLHVWRQADHLAQQATHQGEIVDHQNSSFLRHLVNQNPCFDCCHCRHLK